jgi:hypothetical protein
MSKDVHIVTHDHSQPDANYVIEHLARHWKVWGCSINYGPLKVLEYGLGIMHINQTRVAAGLVPRAGAGCALLNARILDISKTRFSTLRLQSDSSWDGPVIIKSDLNYFGNPELRMRSGWQVSKALRRYGGQAWRWLHVLPDNQYPVLQGLNKVPGWVWKREDLLVERFLPERVGDSYSIRGWLFFGERGYAYRLYSNSPIVKAGNITHFDILDSVPAELQAFRREQGVDFGKFDYVEVEGKAVLLDLNKTPTTIARQDSPRMRDMAEGLFDFPGMGR